MKKKHIEVGQYIFSNQNIDGPGEKFLKDTAPLIGYIVFSFNSLEDTLNQELCELIGARSDSLGIQVIHKRGYAQKVDLFKRIIMDLQNTMNRKVPILDILISELLAVGKLRNQVVHSDWESVEPDGYTCIDLKVTKKGTHHIYVQFTLESLHEIWKRIEKVFLLFDDYSDQMQDIYTGK